MKKHMKYLSYVVRHKWFVFLAGIKTGTPLWQLIIHDWHKFTPVEWFPYVAYFHSGIDMQNPPEQIKKDFDNAWLHHQHLGKHHWQHWILRRDDGGILVLKMPNNYVREMLADWMGAGRAITGKWEAEEWFLKNHENIILSPKTWLYLSAIFFDVGMYKASDLVSGFSGCLTENEREGEK